MKSIAGAEMNSPEQHDPSSPLLSSTQTNEQTTTTTTTTTNCVLPTKHPKLLNGTGNEKLNPNLNSNSKNPSNHVDDSTIDDKTTDANSTQNNNSLLPLEQNNLDNNNDHDPLKTSTRNHVRRPPHIAKQSASFMCNSVPISNSFNCESPIDHRSISNNSNNGSLVSLTATTTTTSTSTSTSTTPTPPNDNNQNTCFNGEDKRGSIAGSSRGSGGGKKSRIVIRKFQKLDLTQLSSTPAPEVKIGQRVAYKEYYGNEFGTIRWIGRVPQICPDWTAGVEFDNAIGEGDGSLNGRRYFIAKDCFAKFLPLTEVAFVDQHVGRPEPGTMISVMSAAVRPGQMISIQRVSTVHVQHCFLNAPHQIPGADILAVNSRLHCQCPNCGPCAHVIKPPRTQRLARSKKNATHMCQFSTYTCCGMESQEEAMCTYTGNRATSSLPPPVLPIFPAGNLPPIGNSWIEGAGYLTQLQAQQSKMMPDEYKMGAAPEDATAEPDSRRHLNRSSSSRRGSGRHHHHHEKHRHKHSNGGSYNPDAPTYNDATSPEVDGRQSGARGLFDDRALSPKSLETDTNKIHHSLGKSTPPDGYPNQQSQFYTNDSMQDPPSYSPNPDYANFNNNNTASHKPATYLSGAAFPKSNTSPYVEPVWCESSSSPPKLTPKSAAKVVYRDSIENRYLFPTDEDPIDSTLEADLENLSQARYGPHSTTTNTNLRLNGSKNIFKSLRSLVSCLSAQSNHSEIMERRSENTMKFSEFGDRTGQSKAVPVLFDDKQPLDDDFFVHSINRNLPLRGEEKENLIHQQHQVDINDYNNIIRGANINKQLKMAHNNNNNSNNVTSDNHNKQQTTIMRQISSSSDCGFSSASQNSINFQSYHANVSPQISAEEKHKRLQIYNNFLAHLISSTTMNEDDLNRLRRVLFEPQFDNCCPHGGVINQVRSMQDAFNGEAEQILLADGSKKSCMFHEKGAYEQVQRATSACYHTTSASYQPNDEISKSSGSHGDRPIRKSTNRNGDKDYCLNSAPHDSVQSSHVSTNLPKRKSLIDGASTTSESATLSSYDSFTGTAMICGDNQSISSKDPSDGRGNIKTRLESDKLQTNGSNSAGLPKAFELKLTLSINNSEKSKESLTKDPVACLELDRSSDGLDGTTANGNLLNSTFNINIISQKSNDDSATAERKFVVPEGLNGEDISSDTADCLI